MITIDSLQNPKIKNVVKLLQKSSVRKEQGLFVIDGLREIKEAIQAKIEIETLFYCSEIASSQELKIDDGKVVEVSKRVFKKISYKEKPDGFLVVAKKLETRLGEIKLKKNPLIIVLEAVEKPGNLGAIMRTAYAANVDAIIINDNQTDIYNPNVIRASEGKLFSVPIIVTSREETIKWLKEKDIKTFAASTDAKNIYTDSDFRQAIALVFGSEDKGLSNEWLGKANEKIKIPMQKGIDSLNVSVSTAIMVFEVIRQRSID